MPRFPTLILFSGMGTDAAMFAPQRLAFPELVVPAWLPPEPGETLQQYCRRMAEPLRERMPGVIGGASFGGIVALEVAQYLDPLAVLLIGSVRRPRDLPRRVRLLRPLRAGLAAVPISVLQWTAKTCAAPAFSSFNAHLARLARHLGRADPAIIRWSARQILLWRDEPVVRCPVFQIHGDRDLLFPLARQHPDWIVRGGGHVISVTHGAEVNAFIRHCLAQVASQS